MNQDLKTLEERLDNAYMNGILHPIIRDVIKVLKGFEDRVRDLEKRFEDSEG